MYFNKKFDGMWTSHPAPEESHHQVSDLSEVGQGPGLQEMSKIKWKEGEWPETQLLEERKDTLTTTVDFENSVKKWQALSSYVTRLWTGLVIDFSLTWLCYLEILICSSESDILSARPWPGL